MKKDKVFVVKDASGNYFCGVNHWDKQIRNARFYHSKHYANNVVNDNQEKGAYVTKVLIIEECQKEEKDV